MQKPGNGPFPFSAVVSDDEIIGASFGSIWVSVRYPIVSIWDGTQFPTIIQDLQSGAVIHVGEGKGVSALSGALNKLKLSKLKIVTMDMVNAYYSWIHQEFPNVKIIFDHFHFIKLMNDKLDKARRRITAKLNIIQQKQLKGLRFIFLKNNENLPEDAKIHSAEYARRIPRTWWCVYVQRGFAGYLLNFRWLIKQAYGFRDSEYFFKIYQLPEISSVKEL